MSVASVSSSPLSSSYPGQQVAAGQSEASAHLGSHTCPESPCPFCSTQAFQAPGTGRNVTEQAAGAALVAGSMQQGPLLGDRVTLAHRHGQAQAGQGDFPGNAPGVGLGLDTGYGPDARPVAGTVHDQKHHHDESAARRGLKNDTKNPAQGRQASSQGEDTKSQDREGAPADMVDEQELSVEERRMLEELRQRDAEVRAHEQAHIAAGGPHVRGGANYTYQTGPDGRQYAVGGEVSIDTSAVPGNPELTEQKAQTVRRAALAPANPSAQDLKVAASASQMEAEARAEKLRAEQEERSQQAEQRTHGTPGGNDAARAGLDGPASWTSSAGHSFFGHADLAGRPDMMQGRRQAAVRAYQNQSGLAGNSLF